MNLFGIVRKSQCWNLQELLTNVKRICPDFSRSYSFENVTSILPIASLNVFSIAKQTGTRSSKSDYKLNNEQAKSAL